MIRKLDIQMDAFVAAVERYSDDQRRNLRDPNLDVCLYATADGSCHCLLGQIYLDLGGDEASLVEADFIGAGAEDLFQEELVRKAAVFLQITADFTSERTWSDAIAVWKICS